MELLEKLNKEEIRELFSKNWMTHDAMWYGSCMQSLSPDQANSINKAAVRLMAGIEIKRIAKLMGKPKGLVVKDFQELAEIIDTTFTLIKTGFMNFEFSFPEKNVLSGVFNECFAHDGVTKFGMIEHYDCGIVERIKGWLDGLGVEFEMTPDFDGCLMHKEGKCEIEFCFKLD